MEKIDGPVDISPKQAGYDEKKIGAIIDYLAPLIDGGTLQGASFLMARQGKVFASAAMGRLTGEKGSAPLKPDSLKRIASITKIFTATAVMKLVEDGKLWLEQPVKTIIPEFDNPLHGSIHIRHLLTHTSGLPADEGYFLEPYPVDRFMLMREEGWLKKAVLCGPLTSRPGETWAYSSVGFGVLAEIVSRVSGRHFNSFVEKEIFAPLGLSRTFMEVPKPLWPEVCRIADWDQLLLEHAADRKAAPDGAGGAYSTIYDLFRFGQYFLNGGLLDGVRILSRKAVEEMTRNQLAGVPAFHWGKNLKDFRHGLGWGFFSDGSTVGPATYNHDGWGWATLYVDPVEQFIFVMFAPDANPWNPVVMVHPRTIAFSGIL
jgi:CubicO group peptidase (beta-lactamase class C family)